MNVKLKNKTKKHILSNIQHNDYEILAPNAEPKLAFKDKKANQCLSSRHDISLGAGKREKCRPHIFRNNVILIMVAE